MQLHVFYLRDFVPKYVKHKGSTAFVIPILISQSQHPMFNQYYRTFFRCRTSVFFHLQQHRSYWQALS